MSDTAFRYLLMLQNIPRAPQKTSAQQLQSLLQKEGYSVHERSIQRDLQKLSAMFPLHADDRKPRGWWFDKNAPAIDIPGMNLHQAITFKMVEQSLKAQLPKPTSRYLQSYFKEANKKLREQNRHWPKKVRALSRSQTLLPPEISPKILSDVYDSLLNDTVLNATYLSRAKNEKTKRSLHPLGLIFRGPMPYLVAREKGENAKTFALTRFAQSATTSIPCEIPKGFSLDAFMAEGEISFPLQKKTIRLKARFSENAMQTFRETAISKDQEIKGDLLVANIHDTKVLRAFLLSFGPRCEVLKPLSLRRALQSELTNALKPYL